MRRLIVAAVALCGLYAMTRADEEKIPLDKVPKTVLEAGKKRFPKAEVVEASKETEDGKTVYEIEMTEGDKKIDVTLTAEGTITNIEKHIDAKELPKAVVEALDKKYPKATFKVIEEVTQVRDGKEAVAFYEAVLMTAEQKIEVKVSPDGKIKGEDDKKEEKKEEKGDKKGNFTDDFSDDKADLSHTGKNPYFILEPGYQLLLEGGTERVVITVLAETKTVDGVECRVVEERETKGDKLVEVSRNYFAISKRPTTSRRHRRASCRPSRGVKRKQPCEPTRGKSPGKRLLYRGGCEECGDKHPAPSLRAVEPKSRTPPRCGGR